MSTSQGVSVEAVDPVFQAKMLDMLKQTGRYNFNTYLHSQYLDKYLVSVCLYWPIDSWNLTLNKVIQPIFVLTNNLSVKSELNSFIKPHFDDETTNFFGKSTLL